MIIRIVWSDMACEASASLGAAIHDPTQCVRVQEEALRAQPVDGISKSAARTPSKAPHLGNLITISPPGTTPTLD